MGSDLWLVGQYSNTPVRIAPLMKQSSSRIGRLTIGLYNTYDPVRFAEAHRRVLARAGALAFAFDCNLATFGFPFDKDLERPIDLTKWLSSTTTVGNEGRYAMELAESGRFLVFDYISKGFPPQLGTPVITTSKPWEERKVTPDWVAEELKNGHSICLVFGLGPHGLKKDIFKVGKHHLDITKRGLSLETCTALGIVPGVIFGIMEGWEKNF